MNLSEQPSSVSKGIQRRQERAKGERGARAEDEHVAEAGDLVSDLRAIVDEGLQEAETVMSGVVQEAEALVPEALAEAKADLKENGAAMERAMIDGMLDLAAALPPGDEQRIGFMIEACREEAEIAGRMAELRFTEPERRAVVLQLSQEQPQAILVAAARAALSLTEDEKIALTRRVVEYDLSLIAEAVTVFKLSSAAVAEVIRSFPKDDRAGLLYSLNIPGPKGEPLVEGIEERMRTEIGPLVEQAESSRAVEAELLLALERAFPDRVGIEQERTAIERGLRGRIEKIGDIGGNNTNAPMFLLIEGREVPAVYKPQSREAATNKQGYPLREGVEAGTYGLREWLAYQIDKALQLDLVPPTILRNGPEGVGAVQDWKIGKDQYDTAWLAEAKRDPKAKHELMRVGFFDGVVMNTDRHARNWLKSADGTVHGIDHGLIFAKQVNYSDTLRSWPLWAVAGEPLADDLRAKAERYLGSAEVQAALKKAFELALGEDAEEAWQGFHERLESMLRDGLPESQQVIDEENYRYLFEHEDDGEGSREGGA